MSFVDDYKNLIIKQYWDRPNASAEIEHQIATWEKIFDFLNSFPENFDIDFAFGDQLDIIGRVVGIDRIVPFVVPKIAFGFEENPNSRSFDDKFTPLPDRAPFQGKFQQAYTSLQLDDNNYRFFIKAKISKNIGGPYIADDEGISISDAIFTLFDGNAYVLDIQTMLLRLYVSPLFNLDRLRAILRLNLLPKPHGVRWEIIVQAAPGETFGFADNPNALPFADKFDLENQPGGKFAEKIIL